MVRENELRENEVAIDPPEARDAGLVFIGSIRTPWTSRMETPRQGRHDGPVCRIEIFEPWIPALKGVEAFERLEVLYWLDRSRRDLVLQCGGLRPEDAADQAVHEVLAHHGDRLHGGERGAG